MEALTQAPAQSRWAPVTPVHTQAAHPFSSISHPQAEREVQRMHDEVRASFPAGSSDEVRGLVYWARLAGGLCGRYEDAIARLDGFKAPAPAISVCWSGIDFEVTGTYHPAIAETDEEPGEDAWFELGDIYLRGAAVTGALDQDLREQLVDEALKQCEQNARSARAARRFPELAGEVL